MKTIWIIDHNSSEPKYGGISRQYDFSKELSKRGYAVVVIASSFIHYTHKYVSHDEMMVAEIDPNIHYVYLRTKEYSASFSISRMYNMYSFYKSVKRNYRNIAKQLGIPDVVVGCSVHPLAWLAAEFVARKYHIRYIAEVRDLWPDVFISKGKSKLNPMIIAMSFIEKHTYKAADKIIYSMTNGDKYINGKLGIPNEKLTLIGQPLDCERYDKNAHNNYEKIDSEILDFIGDSFLCVFTGSYLEYEGVYIMLDAARQIEKFQKEIKFLFLGSGNEYEGMLRYSQVNNMKNVFVGKRIDKDVIPAVLRRTQICLAHLADKQYPGAYKYNASKNKINEYLYSDSCIIYAFEDNNDEVAVWGAGYVIKPFNTTQFVQYILNVYNMSCEKRNEFSLNGRKCIAENHNVEKLIDKYLQVLFG